MEKYENRLIFKNYEYFMAIIEEGGVSKAAEKLFISQSSVSKYLRRLEENIGLKLFSRESHPLCLTEAGKLYLKYISHIFSLEKEFKSNIANWKEGSRGTIKIGIAFFHSSVLFPVIFPEFKKQYPDIHIEVYEGSSLEIISMLDHDKVDFAIFEVPSSYDNLIFEHLVDEPLLFAVNKNNSLLRRIDFDSKQKINRISSADFLQFKDEPFVLMKNSQNSRILVQMYFDKLRFKPNIALETSNVHTSVNLVKTGMGVAFIPGLVIKFNEQAKEILFFQIDDTALQREIGIAYKSANALGKQHTLFIKAIKNLIHD